MLYRHRKRGTTYTIIGVGEVQASGEPLKEGDMVTVYKATDGHLWVRRKAEFEDGRFEEIPENLKE